MILLAENNSFQLIPFLLQVKIEPKVGEVSLEFENKTYVWNWSHGRRSGDGYFLFGD